MELVWIGKKTRNGSPRYLYREDKNYVYFKSNRNMVDLGYYDKKTKTLYFNSRYKMIFKTARHEIRQDYEYKESTWYTELLT